MKYVLIALLMVAGNAFAQAPRKPAVESPPAVVGDRFRVSASPIGNFPTAWLVDSQTGGVFYCYPLTSSGLQFDVVGARCMRADFVERVPAAPANEK